MSQRLRCLPTESRAVIFPQRRQDCPLPHPINRVGFDDLGEEKFRSKVSQKPAFSPNLCRFFFFFFLPLQQETDVVFLQLHRCNYRHIHLQQPSKRHTRWSHHLSLSSANFSPLSPRQQQHQYQMFLTQDEHLSYIRAFYSIRLVIIKHALVKELLILQVQK